MKVAIFVQARMSSTRLPGKVLLPVLGRPLLSYQFERLKRVKNANNLLLLTSTSETDLPIVEFCCTENIPYFRGSLDNVLDRFYQAAQETHPDAIVRITADCPLIDPAIIDMVIDEFQTANPPYDYVSNALTHTFPRGMDVEIFSYHALEKAHRSTKDPAELEHVTLYLYRHPELFKLKGISSPINLSQYRLTVDTPEDFALIQHILEELYPKNPKFELEDIVACLKQHPSWLTLNAHIQQKKVTS